MSSEVANECHAANHVYTFPATFTPKMRANELMRMIYDEEVVGITDRNKPLTAEEVPAARKVAESRRYMLRGAIKWLFHGRTVNHRYTATDRFYLLRWQDFAEKYCQVMKANESKGCIRTN